MLTRFDIDRCNVQGFLFPFDVFDADETGAIRADFDDLLARALDAGWDSCEMTNWMRDGAGWRCATGLRTCARSTA